MTGKVRPNSFDLAATEIRKIILKTALDCGQPVHLGGSLSMVDFLTVLYQGFLNYDPSNPTSEERDIFILSKGHAVLGHLSVLNYFGILPDVKLNSFQQNGSDLIAHPVKAPSIGMEASTGSLGQGISYAVGVAEGLRRLGHTRKVYVVVGDGECNEGSVWEAAALCAERCLDNCIIFVDNNGQRNDGKTTIYKTGQLASIWRAFGWDVQEIDGHSYGEIKNAIGQAQIGNGRPKAIVANTLKGKGISFMQDNNDWHHNRVTQKIFDECALELDGRN